jgi:microsomal epoxide hydrolase
LHFLHVPGKGPNPLPLLLSHGWPGSIWEFHKLIPLLTEDGFTVVAPSLPGYTLSFTPGQRRFGAPEMGDAFLELMRDVLGYERFAAQGGDWGAFISGYMAFKYPEHLLGIHLNLLPLRRDPVVDDGSEEMRTWQAELDHWMREESGYGAIQGTKPQTLAYALTDSPVGLAAWVVEKYRTWSDCDGDVETRFSKDELLTTIMLYWTSGAIGSSFWPYYARQHAGWVLPADARVEVPTAYASFKRDILHPPRSIAERAINIQRWTVFPRGGHFAALEEPEALAADVREFFRPLRSA